VPSKFIITAEIVVRATRRADARVREGLSATLEFNKSNKFTIVTLYVDG
jgi:hypothetical protein